MTATSASQWPPIDWHPIDWEQLPLSRSDVDRAAERRGEPELISTLLRQDDTRVILVRGAEVALAPGPGARGHDSGEPAPVALDLIGPAAQLPAGADLADEGAVWFFLGQDSEGAYLALSLPALTEDEVGIEGFPGPVGPAPGALAELVRGRAWAALRDVGQDLQPRDAGLATTAIALAAWHARHPRCPRCGEVTSVESAGWTRRCPVDGSEHYPRTDPAVIMAVVDDADRLLLGHAAHWPQGRFSTLAGYVEPGEPIEAAVRREVREETQVRVGELTYRGSQPWPFPASLMLGFTARALTTQIRVDGHEVTEARWFTRDELREAVRGGSVQLPMGSSIARALIEDWFGGSLSAEALLHVDE